MKHSLMILTSAIVLNIIQFIDAKENERVRNFSIASVNPFYFPASSEMKNMDPIFVELNLGEQYSLLSRTEPDTMANDQGWITHYTMLDWKFAARFHPSGNIHLENVMIAFGTEPGMTPQSYTCHLYVWENSASNTPGTERHHSTFTVPAIPENYWTWVIPSNFPGLNLTSDFWVGYRRTVTETPPFTYADATFAPPSNTNMYFWPEINDWVSDIWNYYMIRALTTPHYWAGRWPISNSSTPDDLSSPYGPRIKPPYDFHRGVDISAFIDTPVYGVEGGKIIYAGDYGYGYGNVVVVDHDVDKTAYIHLKSILVYKGQFITKGYKIGTVDYPTAPHLHFGCYSEWVPLGSPLDPYQGSDGDVFEEWSIHPLYILPHTNMPSNYNVNISRINYPDIEIELKVPGDVLDCLRLECITQNKQEAVIEDIFVDYEYIARLRNQDQNPVDVDNDGDTDVKFEPYEFKSSDMHHQMDVTFTLEKPLPPDYYKIIVRAYDDNWDLQKEVQREGGTSITESRDTGEIYTPCILFQNYPNPFRGETSFRYQLSTFNTDAINSIHTELKIYDAVGRTIRTLVDENQTLGRHTVQWDGRDKDGLELPSGVYFCCFEVEDYKQIRKIIKMR